MVSITTRLDDLTYQFIQAGIETYWQEEKEKVTARLNEASKALQNRQEANRRLKGATTEGDIIEQALSHLIAETSILIEDLERRYKLGVAWVKSHQYPSTIRSAAACDEDFTASPNPYINHHTFDTNTAAVAGFGNTRRNIPGEDNW